MGPALIAGAIISIGKVVYNMNESEELSREATNRTIQSIAREQEAQVEQEQKQKLMEQQVSRLVTRKRGVLQTSMQKFLDVYGKIKKINFTESDGIREIENLTCITEGQIQLAIDSSYHVEQPSIITKNVVASWLIGGVFGAVSASILDDSRHELELAKMKEKESDAVVEQAKTMTLSCTAVTERVTRMTDVLTKLNILFMKGIEASDEVITLRGLDKNNYSLEDRKTLASCTNLAVAVKNLIDIPIVDAEGELTKECLEAIEEGEKCLQVIQFVKN